MEMQWIAQAQSSFETTLLTRCFNLSRFRNDGMPPAIERKVRALQRDHTSVSGTMSLTGPRLLVRSLTPMIRLSRLYINDTDL